MGDSSLGKRKRLHYELIQCIAEQLPRSPKYGSFILAISSLLPPGAIAKDSENIWKILYVLELLRIISVGNYQKLKQLLVDVNMVALCKVVESREKEILQDVHRENISIEDYGVRNSACVSPNLSHTSGILHGTNTLGSSRQHGRLLNYLDRQLVPVMSEYRSFLTMVRAYLPNAVVNANKGSVLEILYALQTEGLIGVGNYRVLKIILEDSHLNALKADIEKMEKEIHSSMQQEGICK